MHQNGQLIFTGYLQSHPTYALPKKTTVNGVGGYNHVDEEEFNRYSRMGEHLIWTYSIDMIDALKYTANVVFLSKN